MRENNKGFTLIELLAVIIILGILMIIAIPSVTRYINDSRKNAYIDTAKEIISGARNLVNEGNLGMYDTNTTYYIPSSFIQTENASKSPYGDFTEAYIGVTYDGKGYKYYWISVDDAGQGIPNVTLIDKLDIDDIESDLIDSDILNTVKTTGVGSRKNIKIYDINNSIWNDFSAEYSVSDEGGDAVQISIVCKKATTLHEKTCNRKYSDPTSGCGIVIGYNNSITYGSIPDGTLKAGNAYDCDVNNDGIYDPATERFYYITSEGDYSVLVYYTDVNNQAEHNYDDSNENWHGPRTAYQYLPSTTEWSNPGIIKPGKRLIKNAENGSTVLDHTIEEFDYGDRAARLLSKQEVIAGCPNYYHNPSNSIGELNNCLYFFENIGWFENSNTGTTGYYLESPHATNDTNISCISGSTRAFCNTTVTTSHAIRPVITVKTANLEK